MSRINKILVQLGLAAVMLFSFGAVAYDCGQIDDGDENLGVAVVLVDHNQCSTVRSVKPIHKASASTSKATFAASRFGQHDALIAAPIPDSAQSHRPLRT